MATTNEVLVGLDDSDTSVAALNWAADYARAAGLPLRAMHVFADVYPSAAWGAGYMSAPTHGDPDESDKISVERVFAAIGPEVGWRLEFVRGSAGKELVNQSRHARLLALGAREHTGIERLALGSVSHYCFNHAECPVVAVPFQPAKEAAGRPAGEAEAELDVPTS